MPRIFNLSASMSFLSKGDGSAKRKHGAEPLGGFGEPVPLKWKENMFGNKEATLWSSHSPRKYFKSGNMTQLKMILLLLPMSVLFYEEECFSFRRYCSLQTVAVFLGNKGLQHKLVCDSEALPRAAAVCVHVPGFPPPRSEWTLPFRDVFRTMRSFTDEWAMVERGEFGWPPGSHRHNGGRASIGRTKTQTPRLMAPVVGGA